ncbi:hypothetical protein [Acetohalobium arabaticum]|uniref:DUF3311 domain-containing protein n=1 Tax=Acetohalobium arabaticum (strain ATCC 49924 / DSM 5501 / Z-7288) TaxID=574087 RepID=D9QVS6_ACEAZ|nr:hypothetical protein [Acetohalobium arabaticum]ADL12335.1 hypothetical protein Acear_0796 [Acetohalobium arabaticum DSM 5501]
MEESDDKQVPLTPIFFPDTISEKKKKQSIFWVIYFAIVILAQVWPIYLIGNRIHPIILGMPFSMVWIVIWTGVFAFIGLLIRYKQEFGGEN